MENTDSVLRAYKKRGKSLQRRIEIEKGTNKRLKLLLEQCKLQIQEGLLKETITHEIEMLKLKYR